MEMGDDAYTFLKNKEEFFKLKDWKRMEADPDAGSCVRRVFRGPLENRSIIVKIVLTLRNLLRGLSRTLRTLS